MLQLGEGMRECGNDMPNKLLDPKLMNILLNKHEKHAIFNQPKCTWPTILSTDENAETTLGL